MSPLAVLLGTLFWLGFLVLALDEACSTRHPPGPGRAKTTNLRQALLLVLLLAALVTWRWPALVLDRPLHSDEAQFLTQALTYKLDLMPWRSSNGGSAGPLDSYVLTWPFLFGLDPSYATGRLTAIGCVVVTVWFFLKTARLLVGERRATLAILPLTAFYVFAFQRDFIHFSSEQLPMALLAIASYLMPRTYLHPAAGRSFALGVILGATLFAKLQAAPLAAYLGVAAVGVLLFRKGTRPRFAEVRGPLAALITGTLVFPAVLLIPVIVAGAWWQFVQEYLVFGATYSRAMIDGAHAANTAPSAIAIAGPAPAPASPGVQALMVFLHGGEAAIYFLLIALLVGVTGLMITQRRARRAISLPWLVGLGLILGYLAVAAFVIVKPGTRFHHYLFLAVGPAMLLPLWLSRRAFQRGGAGSLRPIPWRWAIAFALAVTAPFAAMRAADPFGEGPRHIFYHLPPMRENAVIQYLRAQARPGDSLVVWGWAPEYYVETHLPSATPDVVGGSYELPGPKEDAYRVEYLKQIEWHKPRFFVDAVGNFYWPSWPQPIEKCRATAYPPLADYLSQHYDLAATLPAGDLGGPLPVMIYVRRD